MVNVYNRRLAFEDAAASQTCMVRHPSPVAPLNRLTMLTDYIEPEERLVACPNQDVVYGAGLLALDQRPVVVQVPDFGDRFWVYQVVDLRTDSFADLGKMYGTKPGFYLLVGPDWKGDGARRASPRCSAPRPTPAFVIPRVFQDDTRRGQAGRPAVAQRRSMMYPLAEFDGKMKTTRLGTVSRSSRRPGRRRHGDAMGRARDVLRRPAASSSTTRRRCPAKRPATRRCAPCSPPRRTDPA